MTSAQAHSNLYAAWPTTRRWRLGWSRTLALAASMSRTISPSSRVAAYGCSLSFYVGLGLNRSRTIEPMGTDIANQWWSCFAQIDGVDVIHIDLSPNTARESQALKSLNDWERQRWERYHSKDPQRRFALSRAALRRVLCEALACATDELEFGWAERGKPRAYVDGVPAPLHFNVSHSGDHGVFAISPDHQVGIDIEEISQRFRFDAIIESTFSADERAGVSTAGKDFEPRTFFELWTLKEAIIKATGVGLSANLQCIETPPAMRGGAITGQIRLPEFPDVFWRLHKFSNSHFVGALAIETVGGLDK